jgi:hypothetical protein
MDGDTPHEGDHLLTWNGMSFRYTWRRPGGWTRFYTFYRDGSQDELATAEAHTSCNLPYLPQDWRCSSKRADFKWTRTVDPSQFDAPPKPSCE